MLTFNLILDLFFLFLYYFDGLYHCISCHSLVFKFIALFEDVKQHLHHFLCDKRNWPSKYIHEVRQYIRMRSVIELLDIQRIWFKFYYCSFVVVDITVIRRGENSDYDWKFRWAIPFVHFISHRTRLHAPAI